MMERANNLWGNKFITAPLKDIKLNFDQLEHESCLKFNKEQRDRLTWIAECYIALRDYGEIPPINEIKKFLSKIGDAASFLEKAFDDYSRSKESIATAAIRSVYPSSDTLGWKDPGGMAAFLSHIANHARNNCKTQFCSGRREGTSLTILIKDLHPVFVTAGGKGRGCSTDGTSKKHYSGHFYNLTCNFLYQLEGQNMAPAGIGKLICSMFTSAGVEKTRKK